jgi:hypothetical protein
VGILTTRSPASPAAARAPQAATPLPPFIAVGVAGVWRFRQDPATIVLFSGILLTGFGSSYYHWNPNDDTLFWDRLPMTLCLA